MKIEKERFNMSEVIKSFKGFNKNLKCRGFQFEVGGEYEEEKAEACRTGFHACESPLEVFAYYAPGNQSRYCVVEQSGEISRHSDDSKVASTKIKIGAEIGIPGLVKAHIEYTKERTIPSDEHHSTDSRSANSATGDWSANSATGYGSANISTGAECSNDGSGERNICVAWGKDSKCKGAVGCFLVLSEWGDWDGDKHPFVAAQMVLVDGETIKADTWYTLKDGQIVEAE